MEMLVHLLLLLACKDSKVLFKWEKNKRIQVDWFKISSSLIGKCSRDCHIHAVRVSR